MVYVTGMCVDYQRPACERAACVMSLQEAGAERVLRNAGQGGYTPSGRRFSGMRTGGSKRLVGLNGWG
jgi:hypothetical protein